VVERLVCIEDAGGSIPPMSTFFLLKFGWSHVHVLSKFGPFCQKSVSFRGIFSIFSTVILRGPPHPKLLHLHHFRRTLNKMNPKLVSLVPARSFRLNCVAPKNESPMVLRRRHGWEARHRRRPRRALGAPRTRDTGGRFAKSFVELSMAGHSRGVRVF
jgi:hypothetical protein